jgi:hypothetical protein
VTGREQVRECGIEGCGRRHKGHGLCDMHLQRRRLTGTAAAPRGKEVIGYDSIGRPIWRRVEDPKAKLLARAVAAHGGCIVWTGSKNDRGYGHIDVNGQRQYTHRLSYELHVGPIPDGLVIDHLCRNRACLNPHHLEPVTQGENTRRGERAQRTHCPQGHPYDEANTYVKRRVNGAAHRNCRECSREQGRARYATRTHCDRGHAYTEDNIIRTPSGKRWCKTCREAFYASRRKP